MEEAQRKTTRDGRCLREMKEEEFMNAKHVAKEGIKECKALEQKREQ